ncbi:hypothetical protein [Acidovorax sp. SUPP2539]|uniref:hypothetical protein n=1 Tax=Acidovorax sp. SUPP2539 TaxID=2920878 RepID=UPI0023DE215D|nr:hypothetical protein [Acidovorax sp. SUPP2539]GKS90699.1 hypothetical protein AVTE2539_15060 [Acidovorax sp. SUPP2539]
MPTATAAKATTAAAPQGAPPRCRERDYQLASTSNRLGGYTQTFTPAAGSAQTTNVSYNYDATGSITRKGDSYLHYGVDGRIAKAGPRAFPKCY